MEENIRVIQAFSNKVTHRRRGVRMDTQRGFAPKSRPNNPPKRAMRSFTCIAHVKGHGDVLRLKGLLVASLALLTL